jgi:hypothetical protein
MYIVQIPEHGEWHDTVPAYPELKDAKKRQKELEHELTVPTRIVSCSRTHVSGGKNQ